MASVSDENQLKFVEELQWCITQLELGLQHQHPDSRQGLETLKVLKILRSNKAPMVKKRQAMRNALGDYRKKMKEYEKKSLAGMRSSKFQPSQNLKTHSKSKFLRQCHSRQQGELTDTFNNLGIENSTAGTSVADLSSSSDTTDLSSLNETRTSSNLSLSRDPNHISISQVPGTYNGRNCFTHVPTDNSFRFGFEEPLAEEEVKETEENGPALEVVNSSEVKCAVDSQSVNRNYYRMEKSDNNFTFNFVNSVSE